MVGCGHGVGLPWSFAVLSDAGVGVGTAALLWPPPACSARHDFPGACEDDVIII